MSGYDFNYADAFSRNIGLLTEAEQEKLRSYTIAIAGMGGVGGNHLMALVRLGFERFKIADMDVYEQKNFNRQYGARIDTIGKAKVAVMAKEAKCVNPNCKIEIFENGITESTVHDFLNDVDLAIDGLDAFEFETRRLYFRTAEVKNIPIITAGPIGFGTAFLIFLPGGPTFDAYFAITDKMTPTQKLIAFFVGLAPALLQRSYMRRTNIEEKRGPSSSGAVFLCAGVVALYALKVLLKKGSVKAVPYYHQFDVMQERYVVKKLYFGNNNPIQRIKMLLAQYLVQD
jgi:sulfur-carrier protein adenylyltransferase/sulfurtransferase